MLCGGGLAEFSLAANGGYEPETLAELVMDYMTPTGLTFGSAINLSAIPEPSSGLMLLLGLAALGLRRKRVAKGGGRRYLGGH